MTQERLIKIEKRQIFAFTNHGEICHAGQHFIKANTFKSLLKLARVCKKIERKWLLWRANYLLKNKGDYPLRHTPNAEYYLVRNDEEYIRVNL